MDYKILDFNKERGLLMVNFLIQELPDGITIGIDVPLVNNNYISGEELHQCILSFKPSAQIERIKVIALNAPEKPIFLVGTQLSVSNETQDQTIERFKAAHDFYLNSKAIQKGYDSIQNAALRAAFPGPYHDEGLAFATWMDACNVIGYEILSEVQSGHRLIPENEEAYFSMLPVLTLP